MAPARIPRAKKVAVAAPQAKPVEDPNRKVLKVQPARPRVMR